MAGDGAAVDWADNEWDAALKRLRADGSLDARGRRISSDQLQLLLSAAPRVSKEDNRPSLEEVDFSGASFGDGASFEGATFRRRVSFDHATFGAGSSFGSWIGAPASFEDEATFEGARFGDEANFIHVAFRGRASFANATFRSGASFAHTVGVSAGFNDEANFEGASFEGGANFDGVNFDKATSFSGAIFSDGAHFARATFGGEARFTRASFGVGADFRYATFRDKAIFSDATFGDQAGFDHATFRRRTDFVATTFGNKADFSDADFGTYASFIRATFGDGADFSDGTFREAAMFIGATFGREARFRDATFSGVAAFQKSAFGAGAEFGPRVAGLLVLDDATFAKPDQIAIVALAISARRIVLPSGATLLVRWALVDLEQTSFSQPSTLAVLPESLLTLKPAGWPSLLHLQPPPSAEWPFLLRDPRTGTLAVIEASLPQSWSPPPVVRDARTGELDPRPRLVSLRRADLANLVLTDVDLTACRFTRASNLDRLRLDGSTNFARAPTIFGGRGRQALAEEYRRRFNTDPLTPVES